MGAIIGPAIGTLTRATLAMTTLLLSVAVSAESEEPENRQSLASSPSMLMDLVSEISFLTPSEYRGQMRELRDTHAFPIGLEQLPQYLSEGSDPRSDLQSEDLEAFTNVLSGIAVRSRSDGEILWGRIQGTVYERDAHAWIYEQLKSFDLEDVHHDPFPTQHPQWRPTACDLIVTSAPGLKHGQPFEFKEAITPFVSANTPPEGISGEVIYVGDGTAAELNGRDLSDKIVLLRGRTQPSALLNSARTAFSRIATGSYGSPAGVIVWWDVPQARQVAGRVGAPGGGDAIGEALPWTSIGNDAGLYLRKLLDGATAEHPVTVRMNIQGRMESGEQRMSGNTYAILPGRSDQFIVIPTHVDGYFYGVHDNGASVALNLALAKHYAAIPRNQRAHGIIFLFQGDHEVPGVGGTLPFIDKHRGLLESQLLLVLRPEHLGMNRPMDEGFFVARSNIADPLMLLVTNRSPALIEIFKRASANYGIAMGDLVYVDPAADEAAFHPPYNDLGAISSGWIQTGKFYHSTADVDWGGVDFHQLEKLARAHAYVIDELAGLSKSDLEVGGSPVPAQSIYQSDLLKILLGNN